MFMFAFGGNPPAGFGGAPFSAGGGSRRFTDASSIEMMRGVDDAEGRFSSVGGRDSFLGGANEEDLGMTDLEPVAELVQNLLRTHKKPPPPPSTPPRRSASLPPRVAGVQTT